MEAVKLLLHNGAQLDNRDLNKTSPLHAAAQGGHTEMVKPLVQRRADPNFSAPDPPLKAGRRNGEITKLLVDYGANPNTPDAIQSAAWDNCADTVWQLLDAGAYVNAKSESSGQTALQAAAAARGHRDILQLLLQKGASS